MTNDQPTQPLTDAELAGAKARTRLAKECQDSHLGAMACRAVIRDSVCANGHMQHRSRAEVDAYRDREALLVEVDRLRSALTALGRNESAAANRALELQEENDRLSAQVQDYHKSADAHVAKFERQHERLMVAEGRIAAARKVLFDDAFEGHAQRYRAVAQALGDLDE